VRASRAGINLTRWCRRGSGKPEDRQGGRLSATAGAPAQDRDRALFGRRSEGGLLGDPRGAGLDSANANRRDPEIRDGDVGAP
jgi:hypothetical protein